MEEKGRFIVGALSWSGLVSAIILQRLYSYPSLTLTDIALVFLASAFAGTVLGMLENIIPAFAISLFISVITVAGTLALPSALDISGPIYQEIALEQALALTVQAFIPFTAIAILMGGLAGGFAADRLGLS